VNKTDWSGIGVAQRGSWTFRGPFRLASPWCYG